MPELSRFFGIIIRMYLEAGGQHSSPHFHAYYQDAQAVFTIDPVGMIEVTGDYRLHVHFLDGVIRQIDLEPILQGGIYGALRDKELFAKVALDSEVGVVCWPNGADFDSSILYQWDDVKEELQQTISTFADLGLAVH